MPLYAKIIIIVSMLPVLAWPTMLGLCAPGSPLRLFVWAYPLYVLAAGGCAWVCWRQRREVSWILILLLLLTHLAMWYAL